jgi:hypothetical protein
MARSSAMIGSTWRALSQNRFNIWLKRRGWVNQYKILKKQEKRSSRLLWIVKLGIAVNGSRSDHVEKLQTFASTAKPDSKKFAKRASGG